MKKILFLFLISFAFLSCSNNNQTADISFSFSRNTLLENQETELNISCKITGPSVNQVKSQKITTQKEVFFSFEEIPVDTSVIVEVNVVDTKNIKIEHVNKPLIKIENNIIRHDNVKLALEIMNILIK